MSKSPEEYFQEQTFAPAPASAGAGFTEAELAFMRKYMGLDATETLRKIGIETTSVPPEKSAPAPELPVPPPVAEPVAGPEPLAVEMAVEPEPVAAEVAEATVPETDPEPAPPALGIVAGFARPEAVAEAEIQVPVAVTEVIAAPAPQSSMFSDAGLSEAAHALAEAASALTEAATALSGAVPAMRLASVAQRLSETGESLAQAVLSADESETIEEPASADDDFTLSEDASAEEFAPVAEGPVAEDAVDVEEPDTSADVPPVDEAGIAEPDESAAPAEDAADEAVMEAAPAETPATLEIPESALPTGDSSDLATYRETVYQQIVTIKAALEGLKADGSEKALADALFRSLVTIKNSSNYMGLDDIKVYAERTAGIVDQGRNTDMDFGLLVGLLEQECGIIEDMVHKAVEQLSSGVQAEASTEPVAVVPADPEPVVQSAPVAAPQPEPAVEVAEPAPVVAEAVAEAAPEPPPAEPAPQAPPQDISQVRPVAQAEPDVHEEMASELDLDTIMHSEPELQMVGFYLGSQEFTVPTMAVQEVIRYQTPAKLPSAPEHVAGVINLRGKMTPLVYLRDMLEVNQERKTEDRFIIVCRRKGLQFGLIIERVHTMYRVPQADIDWGIESHLGVNVDLISGLLKLNDTLVAVVSVDRIVNYVLEL